MSPEQRDAVLRAVFEASRKLGLSAARFLGVSWEITDLAEVLSGLVVPCVGGAWREHNGARVLERNGCDLPKALGSLGCDYWREALDGLVMGVGENERLSRHQSAGHGDDGCLDVLFVEGFVVPRVTSFVSEVSSGARFGPLPVGLVEGLHEVRTRFESMKIRLRLEGVSEGVLYYQLEAEEGVLCGAGGKLLHDSFARAVARVNSALTPKDIAPIAVYGGVQ